MNRTELIAEVRKRMHGSPDYLVAMTETIVTYCYWRGVTSERGSKLLSASLVDEGQRVTDFLRRHGIIVGF